MEKDFDNEIMPFVVERGGIYVKLEIMCKDFSLSDYHMITNVLFERHPDWALKKALSAMTYNVIERFLREYNERSK